MTIRTTATATLVADAELRFSQAGKAICRMRVASNERRYNRDTNQWEDGDSTFIDVSLFGAKARDWEDKQGQRRTSYEILADEIATIVKAQSGGQRQGRGGGQWQQQPQQPADDPWAQTQQSDRPAPF